MDAPSAAKSARSARNGVPSGVPSRVPSGVSSGGAIGASSGRPGPEIAVLSVAPARAPADASEYPEPRTRTVRDQARHQRHADERVRRDARRVHDAHAHHRARLVGRRSSCRPRSRRRPTREPRRRRHLRGGPGDVERGGADAPVAAQAPVRTARDALQGYRGRAERVVRLARAVTARSAPKRTKSGARRMSSTAVAVPPHKSAATRRLPSPRPIASRRWPCPPWRRRRRRGS